MRAIIRISLAPLFAAAAITSVSLAAPVAAVAATHSVTQVGQACPAGTNWDTRTQTCH